MAVEGFLGLPGSGKSYGVVYRAVKALRTRRMRGRRMAANMLLNIDKLRELTGWEGEYVYLQDWEQLVELEDALVLLDELNLWMPSRVWAKVPGKLLWKWAQVRKAGLDIWYTAQHIKRVDRVVRELTFASSFMTSFVGLKFFSARVMAGTGEKFWCWNWYPFRMRVAELYDTTGYVAVPAFVQDQLGFSSSTAPGSKVAIVDGKLVAIHDRSSRRSAGAAPPELVKIREGLKGAVLLDESGSPTAMEAPGKEILTPADLILGRNQEAKPNV